MTRLAKHACYQDAVLWAASGGHSKDGQPTLDAATEIKVRWVETNREGQDAQGSTVTITAEVVAKRDIPVNSVMWLGKKCDLATPPVDLMQVVSRTHASDVKNRATRRELSLMRYSDTLPELAGT